MSNPLNKIVNPETGYRVDVNGKIGKRVLRNYLKILGGGNEEIYPIRDCTPEAVRKVVQKEQHAPGACGRRRGCEGWEQVDDKDLQKETKKCLRHNKYAKYWNKTEPVRRKAVDELKKENPSWAGNCDPLGVLFYYGKDGLKKLKPTYGTCKFDKTKCQYVCKNPTGSTSKDKDVQACKDVNSIANVVPLGLLAPRIKESSWKPFARDRYKNKLYQKAEICHNTLAKGTPNSREVTDKLKALQAQKGSLPCRMTSAFTNSSTDSRNLSGLMDQGYSQCEPITQDSQLPGGKDNTDDITDVVLSAQVNGFPTELRKKPRKMN